MKPTKEERIEVARRLRDNADQLSWWVIQWAAFNDAEEHPAIELHNRLADLIEPEERTCRDIGVDVFMCSACGAFVRLGAVTDLSRPIPVSYCPNCGAKVVD